MTTLPHHLIRVTLLATTIAFAGCAMMQKPASSTSSASPAPMAMAMASLGATLSGASEVPPVSGAATGSVDATFDKATNVLKWKLNYSGLSGPASAAHFHGPAMPGANAGVVVPFTSASSGSEGQATLTPAQVADLMAGKWYANVHTAANPGGEIRGQMMAK